MVIDALGTVTKGLVKGLKDLEIRGQVEIIQTTTLLRSARILERVLEEACCHSDSSERPSANADVKNSKGVKIIMMKIIIIKKLWNMKVTIIPVVIGALGSVTKGLVQRLEDLEMTGRMETVQTTALLKSARILRRVLET